MCIRDSPNILNILKLIIDNRGLGSVCGTGSTGVEGLEDIRVLKPDIVIVDLLMPEKMCIRDRSIYSPICSLG